MDLIKMLNTIRSNASSDYQERIPAATRDNLESIRYAMIDSSNIMVANEFMTTLLNKLVKSVVHTKIFTNPLKTLKQGTKPLGDTIEEIYSNFIKGERFDASGAELMRRNLPDTKTVYHRMNYKMQYPITVSREALSKAFLSYDALDSYINSIINTLYNSAELDEFMNTKQLVKSALDHNAMKVVNVTDPTASEAAGKSFIKAVKTISGLMVFPSTEYNAYLEAQDVDDVPIKTFSRKNEQILILDTATDTSVSIDVLATIFNMSVAEFNETRKIVIDHFPDPAVRGALVDESFFQIYDDLFEITSFYNGKGLYTNYYLNVWQTLAFSILVNAVVFTVGSDSDSDGEIETYSITQTLAEGVTCSNNRKSATEGATYTATLSGVTEEHTVAVTMGGTAVTSTAYTAATGKISIASVTGDIVITVS